MKIKFICFLTIVCVFSCFFMQPIVNAETLEEQRKQAQENREQAENELEYIEGELSSSLLKIQELDDKIRIAEQEIEKMNAQLTELSDKVNETTYELEQVEKDYNQNKKIMEKRLVVMYENGDVSFLDFLLHSSSLIDFLSNYYIVQEIVQSDNEILETIEKQRQEIETKKEQLEKEKTQLKLIKVKQDQTKIIMQNNKTVQEIAMAQLSEQELEVQKKIQEYKDEESRIESQILLASLGYKYAGEFTGGAMLWPIGKSGTYITSGYSTRVHPIQGISKFHTGIDIGNAGFGAPVIAAADGVVSLASYYGGYGNCVMINHGNGISTLYGHGQKILTTVGTEVKKGDVIMEVGSTGVSTGPHLHFEVRVNGQHTNPIPFLTGTVQSESENTDAYANTVN